MGKAHLSFSTSVAIETGEQRWSDLGSWPSFLPLIHESMRYVVEQRIRTANVNIGEFPERRVSMNNGPVTISVQGPDGETHEYSMEFSEIRIQSKFMRIGGIESLIAPVCTMSIIIWNSRCWILP